MFAIGIVDNNAALEKAEEGQSSPARSSTSSTTGEDNVVQYYVKLLFCVIGLQASYLTWGVIQVYTYIRRAWFGIVSTTYLVCIK